MTSWRPSSTPDVAARRASIQRRLRDYFDRESVLEVDTPSLSRSATSDLHIESLAVDTTLCNDPLYLHTSPEFHMKRLLAAGYPDIFSICRVYRDGEAGQRHQPEFTMIEWYRRGFDLDQMIADTVAAIATALDSPRLSRNVVILDYRDAFRDTLKLDPASSTVTEMAAAAGADNRLRDALGDERDGWLDLLLATKIAPTFSKNTLTVIRHYPASQAALARLCPRDADVADRYEVFMGTAELANGYVELTDAVIQADRIASEQISRATRGLQQRPHDQALLDALESGLPACSGVAMGLERLHMLHDNTGDIRDVVSFAFEITNE